MNQNHSSQRLRRLREIAEGYGAVLDAPVAPYYRPSQIPTFIVPDDERRADTVLGQLKIEATEAQTQPRGLKRPSFSKPKAVPPTYTELYTALTRVVEENGPPGVLELLLRKFRNNNGDINVARRANTGTMARLRSSSLPEERGLLIQRATELRRYEGVQLLAPFANQSSLDESLRIALSMKEIDIVVVLLQYGS
jgi:hypothetical protein